MNPGKQYRDQHDGPGHPENSLKSGIEHPAIDKLFYQRASRGRQESSCKTCFQRTVYDLIQLSLTAAEIVRQQTSYSQQQDCQTNGFPWSKVSGPAPANRLPEWPPTATCNYEPDCKECLGDGTQHTEN